MNIRLEPQRSSNFRKKIILLAALGAAAVIGAILFLWTRTVPTGIKETHVEELLRSGDPQFEQYRSQVKLETEKVSLARNYVGNRVVKVTGRIYNGSDHLLEAVEVRITLYSGDRPVLQQTRLPVALGRTRPIPAQDSLGYTFWIEQIPPNWIGGQADVEISGLKFSKLAK
ncbi:MAG: hypothetical protein HY644_10625 [Acidobacteria bacterium]|nr:hypothetical protein [Acidobacteriota bacterium]